MTSNSFFRFLFLMICFLMLFVGVIIGLSRDMTDHVWAQREQMMWVISGLFAIASGLYRS